MSSIKTISINPELFSLPGTKKTKKKTQTSKPKSSLKEDAKRKKNRIKEFRKSFMQKLEMNQNSNSNLISQSSYKPELSSPDVLIGSMPNEFSNSMEYMRHHYEKTNDPPITTNMNDLHEVQPNVPITKIQPTEIKKESDIHEVQPNLNNSTKSTPVPYMLQESSIIPTLTSSLNSSSNTNILPDKPWGNLKGGKKLTYRNWRIKTQKASKNNQEHQEHQEHQVQHTINIENKNTEESHNISPSPVLSSNIQSSLKGGIKKEHITPSISKTSNILPIKKRITKTKTSKTYKLGRSLKSRKINVLLKNKTVKNKVIVAKNKLKHVSLVDIKLYLKKHNLIKSGMSTPHSLLRHMYESAIMSGEVFNSNDDMLIYNFNNPK